MNLSVFYYVQHSVFLLMQIILLEELYLQFIIVQSSCFRWSKFLIEILSALTLSLRLEKDDDDFSSLVALHLVSPHVTYEPMKHAGSYSYQLFRLIWGFMWKNERPCFMQSRF